MEDRQSLPLESTFERTGDALEPLSKTVGRLTKAIKALKADLDSGVLRDISKRLQACEDALTTASQELENARARWRPPTDYGNADYIRELLTVAATQRLQASDRDGIIIAFPSIVRPQWADNTVQIDRKKQAKIRPSFVVRQLKTLQDKPTPFRAAPFLEALFDTYKDIHPGIERSKGQMPTIRLPDVHRRWVRRPGQSTEYTIQEFTRDIYRLDKERHTITKDGYRLTLPASSGTKGSGVLIVVTERGYEKPYYGISFTRPVES